jgi:UDP-3-O-[3-hydroxymyristoyl] glucosamine N-acyltransferase
MSTACSVILDSYPELLSLAKGDKNVLINDVCPSEKAKKGSLVFISNEKHFALALQNGVSALVIPTQFKEKALPFITSQTLLFSPNVTLAMALVITKFFNPEYPKNETAIHPTAQVSKTAKLGKNVEIGAYCVIGQSTEIGDNTKIHPHAVIEHNVKVGSNTVILPHVYIGHGTQIGNFCELKPHSTIASEGYGFAHDEKNKHYRIPQRGIVVIEDFVSIGANCTIDRATFEETRIGEGTKLDNTIHIAHNCKFGKNGLIAAGTMFAGSSIIGNNTMMGGQVAIGGHLEIADNVTIGGRSGVTNDIKTAGAYNGFPIEPMKDSLKTMASLKYLSTLVKDVRKIMKHLNLSSDKE